MHHGEVVPAQTLPAKDVLVAAVPNVLVLEASDAESSALTLLLLPWCAHILNLRALFGGMISRTDLAHPRVV